MQVEFSQQIFNCSNQIRKIEYIDHIFSLEFRPLMENDAEVITKAIINSYDNLKKFMDWSHTDQSVESQLLRIKESNANYLAGLEFDFSVFDRNNQTFLMSASLSRSRTPNKRALSIGYWTSSQFCNRGLASISTKILILVAFEYLNCDRVEIGCSQANLASIKVIEKCSFKYEGASKNYFSEPTIEMIENGYFPERGCFHYALTKEEAKQINWYDEIKINLKVEFV